MWFFSANTKE